jgi:hypothetical protein
VDDPVAVGVDAAPVALALDVSEVAVADEDAVGRVPVVDAGPRAGVGSILRPEADEGDEDEGAQSENGERPQAEPDEEPGAGPLRR